MPSFGYLPPTKNRVKPARLRFVDMPPGDQKRALQVLGQLAQAGIESPVVRTAALQITNHVEARDALGELSAIYDAVKYGTNAVPGLENGLRYVNDPRKFDYYTAPERILLMCREGAAGEDCDGHSALIAALAGVIGFSAGVRMFKPEGSKTFTHVYAIADTNKVTGHLSGQNSSVVALDTTVPDGDGGHLGWEPGPGETQEVWIS